MPDIGEGVQDDGEEYQHVKGPVGLDFCISQLCCHLPDAGVEDHVIFSGQHPHHRLTDDGEP
jgi:hypothetical protein